MLEDEKIIDEFNARTENTEPEPDTGQEQPPTDEQIVEKQARNKPTAATVLQKKTTLTEEKLEQRIDQILAKNAGKISEAELRARVAGVLEHKDAISEADLIQIQDTLLREYDAKQEEEEKNQAPTVQTPAAAQQVADAIGERASRWADAAAALKTPGGIGLLIGVLMFMIWVMVPTSSGLTRLQLLWAVITGQAQWSPQVQQTEEQAASDAINQIVKITGGQGTPFPTNNQGGGGASGGGLPFLAFTFED